MKLAHILLLTALLVTDIVHATESTAVSNELTRAEIDNILVCHYNSLDDSATYEGCLPAEYRDINSQKYQADIDYLKSSSLLN